MNDRRSVQRTRVLRNAAIVVNRAALHCSLQNLTSTGARLSLASTYRIPDTFELTFDQGRSHRLCRVMWRTGTALGIAFEKAPG